MNSEYLSTITFDGTEIKYRSILTGAGGYALAYYTRERVAISALSSVAEVLIVQASSDLGVSYNLPANTDVTIEVTNLLPLITDGFLTLKKSSGRLTKIPVARVGAENRKNIIIPTVQVRDGFYQYPPHTIYAMDSDVLTVECGIGEGVSLFQFGEDEYTATPTQQYETIEDIPAIAGEKLYINVKGDTLWSTYIREVPCGVQTVVAYWSGRLGGEKRLVWFVKDMTEEVTESQDIQVKPNVNTLRFGVDVRKNYRETMTLYLPNLDAYDTYYYADLITSDSVSIDGRTVRVLSSAITYPNGSDRGSVEVTIEFTTHNTILV